MEAIICLPPGSDANDTYTICLNTGVAKDFSFPLLHGALHPKMTTDAAANSSSTSATLLPYFYDRAKVTIDHNGQYHKGFIIHQSNQLYQFSVRCCGHYSQELLGVDLSNLAVNCPALMEDALLLPSHSTISSFLRL